MSYGGIECEKNSVEKRSGSVPPSLSNLIDGRLITLNQSERRIFREAGASPVWVQYLTERFHQRSDNAA